MSNQKNVNSQIKRLIDRNKAPVNPSVDIINGFVEAGMSTKKKSPVLRIINSRPKNPNSFVGNYENHLVPWEEIQKIIRTFISTSKNTYLAFGGVGDILLLLATCWNVENPHVIFNANNESKEFAQKFFDYFNVKNLTIKNTMGTINANRIVSELELFPSFRQSAHLADNLDFGDWERNFLKYKERIQTNPGWNEIIGTDKEFLNNPTVVICPSGSIKINHRKRYLEKNELFMITDRYIKAGWRVVITSNETDLKYYGLHHFDNVFWMTSDKLITRSGKIIPISFDRFLKIINSSKDVISAETWLKTFTLLLNKPTKVIKVRIEDKYQEFGIISADYIFINPNLWKNLSLVTVQEILNQISL
jgi:hypothetical protein